ncbi:MAG: hypothetical protein ABFR62_13325 [Bacteroidota bacterium]
MAQITLNIKDNQLSFFLELIEKLDFVQLNKESDWWDDLSVENKNLIEKGLSDIEKNNIHSDEDVRSSIRKRISEAQK